MDRLLCAVADGEPWLTTAFTVFCRAVTSNKREPRLFAWLHNAVTCCNGPSVFLNHMSVVLSSTLAQVSKGDLQCQLLVLPNYVQSVDLLQQCLLSSTIKGRLWLTAVLAVLARRGAWPRSLSEAKSIMQEDTIQTFWALGILRWAWKWVGHVWDVWSGCNYQWLYKRNKSPTWLYICSRIEWKV